MPRLQYELFLRKAFGYALNISINRIGDPAQLADTDTFADRHLSKILIGVGYSMEIFINDILNNVDLDDDENSRLNLYTDNILECNNLNEVTQLITNFENDVLEVYYDLNDGILTRRNR